MNNNIKILDCTLRDGGYCNQWNFGFKNIKKIITGLIESNIDIIECGFITNKVEYSEEKTKFSKIEQVDKFIPKEKKNKMYVAMINYGEYEVEDIPICSQVSIDGLRIAFHKKDMHEAMDFCKKIKEKGYKIFIQAMVSLSYNDDEFFTLLKYVNKLNPYAFYIVDSFGEMKPKDLKRLYLLVENNLSSNVVIGFHSHNNLQLAFNNAQILSNMHANKEIIIDTSVYGMGRGAGNLNTELFIQHVNDNYGGDYKLPPLLNIIDEVLEKFYKINSWGYSLPNFLSAVHNAHPNYACFLDEKKTLTVSDINNIFENMSEDKKYSYDKKYIEDLYKKYMESLEEGKHTLEDVLKIFKNKTVLVIAPGKSSFLDRNKIAEFSKRKDTITISVNFIYNFCDIDYIFLSNLRRYRDMNISYKDKYIVTSNIPFNTPLAKIDYKLLINEIDSVFDNAGLMAIKMLTLSECKEIVLAGYDGYSHEVGENYFNKELEIITDNYVLDKLNVGMSKKLNDYSKLKKISFLTQSRYLSVNEKRGY